MVEYFFEVNVIRNNDKTGTLSSFELPTMEVINNSQFVKDKKKLWTPEHLIAGAISADLMTTFLALAETEKLDIISYKSNSLVKLENRSGVLKATEILIRPIIKLIHYKNFALATELMDNAEKSCVVKNMVNLNIEVHTNFEINK